MTNKFTDKVQLFKDLQAHLNQSVLGQHDLVKKLVIALLADGHLLVEGAPGLAKTRAIKELAKRVDASFHRVQFTPDLLPGDLTGTEIYSPAKATFEFQQGPIFFNVVLADEINRAPAKVQSALLEAMEERQVTIGKQTYTLPELFLVMATQNPIEQEGTYPLPEAQLDRFLLYVKIDYPDAAVEGDILRLSRAESMGVVANNLALLSQEALFEARQAVMQVHTSPALENYLVQLITATRKPEAYDSKLATWLRFGASPRGTIALDKCAKAHAWLAGKDYVTPEDIHAVVYDVLRHRILLSFAAEADGITPDDFIAELLKVVAIP